MRRSDLKYGVMIIDRSNLDERIAYKPSTKEEITRRQELETGFCARADVLLATQAVNCPTCNHDTLTKQYLLYVTATGFCGDLELLDVITAEEREKLEGIAKRMRQNAIDFPPAAKLLR